MGKLIVVSFVALLMSTVAGCASKIDGEKSAWKCNAKGLVDESYNGYGTAYIHLEGFSKGGDYWVNLNEQRTEGYGTTANGTPFTCKKIQ